MPKFRSAKSIAAAAESTGTARRRRIAVMKSDHTGSGMRNIDMPGARMFTTVVM